MKLLTIGRILGTHNLKGEVKVLSFIENIDKLIGEKIILDLEDNTSILLIVKNITFFNQNKWILSFEEINNKQDAIKLRNSKIKVKRETLGIKDDELFLSDMIGMKVFNINNNENIGEVVDIMETVAHNIFVVTDDEYETLIPDVDEFIKKIDTSENTIYVNLYEGMKEKFKK